MTTICRRRTQEGGSRDAADQIEMARQQQSKRRSYHICAGRDHHGLARVEATDEGVCRVSVGLRNKLPRRAAPGVQTAVHGPSNDILGISGPRSLHPELRCVLGTSKKDALDIAIEGVEQQNIPLDRVDQQVPSVGTKL